MSSSAQQKKHFRSIGHSLKPLVTIAQKGLTENIMAELNRALNDHELIKLKIAAESRESREALLKEVQTACSAEVIQKIGHIALLFRAAKNPDPKLSNLLRSVE